MACPDAELIVVDDGSTDDTRALCAQHGVTVISRPYSMGNGAAIKAGASAAKGDIYYGLWYPIVVAAITLVIGMLFVRETKDNDIHAELKDGVLSLRMAKTLREMPRKIKIN